MGHADIDGILVLERENPSPWTRSLVAAELVNEKAVLLVAEAVGGELIGWLGARVLSPEAELLKIAVQRHRRRMGVAGRLFSFLCRELAGCGCRELFLEVRAKNIGAIKFYLVNNFVQIGQRALYYRQPDDDALVLARPIAGENDTYGMGKEQ